MKRIREFGLFLIISISILFVSFYFHQSFLEDSGSELVAKLIKSYSVNLSLFIVGSILFFLISSKMKDRLGFIFLFWVIAKFMITYKLLYTDFKSDGVVTKIELLAIVLPYLLALFSLTFYAVRLLNKPEEE